MTTTTKTLTVADVAKALKMKPKALRRRLRGLTNVPYVKGEKRWVFTPANAKKVVALVKKAA